MNEKTSEDEVDSENAACDEVGVKMSLLTSTRPTNPPKSLANRLKAKLNQILLEKRGNNKSEDSIDRDSVFSDDSESDH